MKKHGVHYVQFDIQKTMSDPDYMVMSMPERGLYLSMIFVLFANSGSIKFNPELYKIFNFENEQQFLEIWDKIKNKFRITNGKIYSKEVTTEMRRIKKLMHFYTEQGLKGAQKRWAGHSPPIKNDSTPIAKGKETKGKENEITENNTKENNKPANLSNENHDNQNQTYHEPENINVPLDSHSVSPGSSSRCSDSLRDIMLGRKLEYETMRFVDALNHTLHASSRSDRTCFNNVARFLADGCREGRFTSEIFDRVLDYAKQARTGQNPNALFMSLMRQELGYKKQIKY